MSSETSGHTRAQLRQMFRFYLDNLGTGNIPDTSDTQIDANDLLMMAYEEYARQTRCFNVSYTLAATADTAIYAYSDFGEGAGARVFAVSHIAYNGKRLDRRSLTDMDNADSAWRSKESGSPAVWIPWGDSAFRLYPAPSGTDNITFEGWSIPSVTSFDSDTECPSILKTDQPLIAIYAAILATIKNPNDENAIRQSALYPQWNEGIQKANRRIHGTAETVVYGKYTDRQPSRYRNVGSIINLP